MARGKGKNGGNGHSKKRAIDRYEHTDKKRINNPPVGLVTPETDPPLPTHKVYDYIQPVPSVKPDKNLDYDAHLDPQLVWAGKKEHASFEVPTVSLHVHETIEASEAFELDRSPLVAAWVKNDHLGFEITYSFRGIIRKFRPDYMLRFTGGKILILEVKGQDNQEQQTKREFLSEWVRAINAHGGFGIWAADVSRHPTDIHEILARHSA